MSKGIQQAEQWEVKEFPNSIEQSRVAAEEWLSLVESRTADNPLLVAISGGRSAAEFFGEVASQGAGKLYNAHFFWADERCVPPTSPDSNFWLADQNLFRPLAIPSGQIHRIHGELEPRQAAEDASTAIGLWTPKTETGVPILDLVILGVGEDGHVASLFPNSVRDVLDFPGAYLGVTNSPKPPPKRVSLSYSAIATANDVWVLVSGEAKARVLRQSLRPDAKTPLAHVLHMRQRTTIFTDIPVREGLVASQAAD